MGLSKITLNARPSILLRSIVDSKLLISQVNNCKNSCDCRKERKQ